MILSHKIRLVPNKRQEDYFRKSCGVARHAYNWALAEWKRQYALGEKPNETKLRKQYNSIKREEFPWSLEVTKTAPQQSIKNLGSAFSNFFRRVKRGKNPGFPKFKKKGVNDRFRAEDGTSKTKVNAVVVDGKKIKLPRIGWIKMRELVRFDGQIKSVIISRIADKWFASVAVDVEHLHHTSYKNHGGVIGVDVGIKHLATLSNGTKIVGPKPHAVLLNRLRLLHKSLSRKKKGSANRYKAKMRLTKLYYRIFCIRQDVLHKLTTGLVLDYDTIGIEDLAIKKMCKKKYLSKHILDMGFYEFRRQLEYKAFLYNSKIVVADKYFPSSKMCSHCGRVLSNLPLSVRSWKCKCGVKHDRDINAAINLKKAASSAVSACGHGSADHILYGETTMVEAGKIHYPCMISLKSY